MEIIKASGEKEKFSQEKIYNSLKRAGADTELAERICRQVSKKISPGINSEKIFTEVTRCLKRENPIIAARYSLKRAIMELGPAGFLFEKYIAEILREYGYETQTGKIVKGYCVRHEIDVIAKKQNKHFLIECKYHNTPGSRSDLKVTLYTFARFLDVKKGWEEGRSKEVEHFHQAWLVTNTRCTSEAINYARCVGLKIIAWHYPEDESLEYLIEKKELYPVTILPSLSNYAKQIFSQKGLMLVKDIVKYSSADLAQITGLPADLVEKLQNEARGLCPA